MFDFLGSIAKAGVSLVAAPVLAVADVVCMPSDAYDGRGPFERSGGALAASLGHLNAAITPGSTK